MRVITLAALDDEGTGRFIGTFTQIKLAVEYIEAICDDLLEVNLKRLDANRVSAEFRKNHESCNIHDSDGYIRFSLLRAELNPEKGDVGL